MHTVLIPLGERQDEELFRLMQAELARIPEQVCFVFVPLLRLLLRRPLRLEKTKTHLSFSLSLTKNGQVREMPFAVLMGKHGGDMAAAWEAFGGGLRRRRRGGCPCCSCSSPAGAARNRSSSSGSSSLSPRRSHSPAAAAPARPRLRRGGGLRSFPFQPAPSKARDNR